MPEAAQPVIAELAGVTKRFRATTALAGIDIAVGPGEVVALLGPNGAGKTTAISILCGRRRPDAGTARLFGRDSGTPAARRRLGVTPQGSEFPRTLRVAEVVDLVRAHYPAPRPRDAVLHEFGLTDVADRQTGGLSGGQRRRLGVALAFAGNPAIAVLDEPTTGLDTAARRALWEAARAFVRRGGTLLLTTHYLEEAEALADRVVVIDHGRITASGSVAAIRARVTLAQVSFRATTIPDLPGIERAERAGDEIVLYSRDADGLVRSLVTSDTAFSGLAVRPATLEEAILSLTGDPS